MDKKQQIPHILQIGSSSWQDQVELPAGLGWHFFQATTLPSLKEYMEEEEISKFKALILEKPEDLLALGEDLAYFQPYTVFYDQSHELEAPSDELAQASKTLGFLKQTSISLCLRPLFIRQSIWRCLYGS